MILKKLNPPSLSSSFLGWERCQKSPHKFAKSGHCRILLAAQVPFRAICVNVEENKKWRNGHFKAIYTLILPILAGDQSSLNFFLETFVWEFFGGGFFFLIFFRNLFLEFFLGIFLIFFLTNLVWKFYLGFFLNLFWGGNIFIFIYFFFWIFLGNFFVKIQKLVWQVEKLFRRCKIILAGAKIILAGGKIILASPKRGRGKNVSHPPTDAGSRMTFRGKHLSLERGVPKVPREKRVPSTHWCGVQNDLSDV